MKYAILTFLIAIAAMTCVRGQYLERGTIVTDSAEYKVEDVYIQPAKEEAKQRKKTNFLQRKIEKLKHISSHKNELLSRQEQLIDTIASLEATVEALTADNALLHQEVINSSLAAIDLANVELTRLEKEVGRLKKKVRLITLVVVGESLLLVIIII